jgi:hypothetical protein
MYREQPDQEAVEDSLNIDETYQYFLGILDDTEFTFNNKVKLKFWGEKVMSEIINDNKIEKLKEINENLEMLMNLKYVINYQGKGNAQQLEEIQQYKKALERITELELEDES